MDVQRMSRPLAEGRHRMSDTERTGVLSRPQIGISGRPRNPAEPRATSSAARYHALPGAALIAAVALFGRYG